VILTMSELISVPYRRGRDNHTNMIVGCIKMQLASIKMLVHLYVGLFTFVTSLFVMIPKQVSIRDLTQMSITVTSGVGACNGHVSMTRLGEIAIGC
jgi:hypothetical protein